MSDHIALIVDKAMHEMHDAIDAAVEHMLVSETPCGVLVEYGIDGTGWVVSTREDVAHMTVSYCHGRLGA